MYIFECFFHNNVLYSICHFYICFKFKKYIISYILRCKERSVINGMTGKVQYCQGQTDFIKSGDKLMPIFPVYRDQTPYHPLVPAYCFTVNKVMGQTLSHIILVFNSRYLAPVVGYVTLSRLPHIDIVVPMVRLRKTHFINYKYYRYFATFKSTLTRHIYKLYFQ